LEGGSRLEKTNPERKEANRRKKKKRKGKVRGEERKCTFPLYSDHTTAELVTGRLQRRVKGITNLWKENGRTRKKIQGKRGRLGGGPF